MDLILADLTPKEPSFWALGSLLLGDWGHKNKKGRRKEKENPVWRQGRLKGCLRTTPELDLREGLQGEECAVPF